MTTRRALDIVVLGAGMTGQTAALLLARDGHHVTILDRDVEPPPSTAESAWTDWNRPGVSQFRQPHLMLPRWRQEMVRELPELLVDLIDGGAARVNLLHLQPADVTQGWQPGDEQFETITARRPVLEAALGRLVQTQPGIVVRRGVRATGLVTAWGTRGPRVRGVRTAAGEVPADLVVDAAGRHTPVPAWVRALNGDPPVEHREDCGFVYYSRTYRAHDGVLPHGRGPVLSHYPSLSVLTLPGDLGTYCVVLVTSSRDRDLRTLRLEDVWTAAASCVPAARPWQDSGVPLTDVMPLAGLHDVHRGYVREGRPVVTGLVAVGDAATATNPSLGRGATLGALDACALRDAVAGGWSDPRELALAFADLTAHRVSPWVELTTRFDRHRLGEMDADIAGTPYHTTDATWPLTTSLLAGAGHDPVLARAACRIASMLSTPIDVFSAPEIARRVRVAGAHPRYPSGGPSRADLVAAARGLSVDRPTSLAHQ